MSSKTDTLQVQLPNVLSLENLFDKVGALNKRPGYDIFWKDIATDVQITSVKLQLIHLTMKYVYLIIQISYLYSFWQNVMRSNRGPAIWV